MKELIGCCGLDCEKCNAYIATVNNDDALRAETAKLWSELNNAPITSEMINCMGCRVDGVKTPFCDYMCEIRKCAVKNEYSTCGECKNIDGCEKAAFIFENNAEARANLKGTK